MADQTIVIPQGATLSGLAKQYGTDVATLAKANNIADINKIYAGAKLTIPGAAANPHSADAIFNPPPQSASPASPITPSSNNQNNNQNQDPFGGVYSVDPDAANKLAAQKVAQQGYDPTAPVETDVQLKADAHQNALNEVQDQIDAINQTFAAEKARVYKQYQDLENGRMGSEGALLANTGMAGTTFGEGNTNALATSNTNEMTSVEQDENAKQAAAIAAVMDKVNAQADTDYAAKKAAMTAGADNYLKNLNDRATLKTSNINTTVQNLVSAGVDPTDTTKLYNGQTIGSLIKNIADNMTGTQLYGVVSPQDIMTQWTAANTAAQQKKASDTANQVALSLKNTETQANIDKITSDIKKGNYDLVNNPDGSQTLYNKDTGAVARQIPASGGGGQGGNVIGTTGNSTIDTTADGYTTKSVAGGLSQSAIDQAALHFALTGVMPSIGLGSTGAAGQKRTAIQNRAAELDSGGNIAANKAQLASLTTTLTTQTGQQAKTQQSLASAEQNGQQLIDLFKGKINNSNVTFANAMANAASYQLSPSDIASFNSGLQEVANDYRTVFAQGGQNTDAQLKQSQAILNGNISMSALQNVMNTLQTMGKTRLATMTQQVQTVQDQINKIIGGGSNNNNQSTPLTRNINGTIYTQKSDGKWYSNNQ